MRGDLITCAAATSVGKTAIGCNFITRHKRHGVLLFSAEMSRERLMRRMIADSPKLTWVLYLAVAPRYPMIANGQACANRREA